MQATDAVSGLRMFLLADQPAHRVERVHAGVAQIGRSVLPEPVPAVVEVVLVERPVRCRSKPQVVVHARRHWTIGHDADRIAEASDDGLPHVDGAEPAVTHELHGLGEQRAAAPLRSNLDDPVVAPRRLDHAATFDDVVADGLFDVDVLAGLAGPDGHERVPVIGRGDRHGIDVAVVEHAPEIGFRGGLPPYFPLTKASESLKCRSSMSTTWVTRTFLSWARCS